MDALSSLVVSSLDWVWRASWQASVLASLVLLLRRLFRRHIPSRWRHLIWYAVIARLVLPVSLESMVSVFNLIHRNAPATIDLEEPIADPPLPVEQSASLAAGLQTIGAPKDVSPSIWARPEPPDVIYVEPPSWQGRLTALLPSPKPLVAWIWFSGTLMLIGWTLWADHRLLCRLRSRPIVTDLGLLRILGECKRALGVRKDIPLVQSQALSSPALYGLSNPVLILPEGLAQRFGEDAIRHVILHELCHLRRWDIASNWLATLLQSIHWFNPVVWLAMSRYRADREMARDAEVVECLGIPNAAAYARTVLKLLKSSEDADRPLPVPGLAGISEDGRSLRRRILSILGTSRIRTASVGLWKLAFLILMLVSLTDARVSAPSPEDEYETGLVLKVVHGKSGDPIPSAEIRAGFYLTHADGGGHGIVPLNYNPLVTIRAEGYVPAGFRISELDGCWPDACTLTLYEGLTIGGMLSDEIGAPVVGASIVVEVPKDGANGQFDLGGLRTWSTASGQDGRWKCGGLPPDFRDLVLRIRHPMFRDATLHAISSAAGQKREGAIQVVEREKLISGNATTVLHRGLPITGLVLDAGGNPVEGARVWQEGEAEARQTVSVLTSADGGFLFGNASKEPIRLTAEAPGYVPQTRFVGRESRAGSLCFYLAKGYPLRGRVTDEQGANIPGAQVRIETGEVHRLLQSDVFGRFSWDSAPARVTLRAGAQGFESSEAIRVAATGQEHRIRLSRTRRFTIEGRVLDSRTSRPLPRFRVVAGWTQTLRPVRSFLALGREGRFRLAVDEPVLPGERLSLRFEAPGYLWRHAVILPASESEITVRLTMAEAPAVTGRIVAPSGLPVTGAHICVLDRPSDLVWRAEWDRWIAGKSVILSGSSGQFTLPLSAGQGYVLAFHPDLGIGEAPIREFMQSRRITLQPWGAVEGVLRIGQSPGAEQAVILSSLLRDGTASAGWIKLTAEADGDGTFRFDRLPPGEYRLARLHLLDEGGSRQAGQFLTLPVRPGETTTVNLGGRGYRVTGRVVLVGTSGPIPWNQRRQRLDRVLETPGRSGFLRQSQGEDPERRRVGAVQGHRLPGLGQSYVIEFDPDGSFRIDDVLPGTYDLRIQTPELLTLSRRIVIPPLPSSRDNGELELGALTIR